jgi:hypothetical protein
MSCTEINNKHLPLWCDSKGLLVSAEISGFAYSANGRLVTNTSFSFAFLEEQVTASVV